MQNAGEVPWKKREPKAFFRGTLNCNAIFPHRLQGLWAWTGPEPHKQLSMLVPCRATV